MTSEPADQTFLLMSTSAISLNDRFSALPWAPLQEVVVGCELLPRRLDVAHLNQRLALQMESRPSVWEALQMESRPSVWEALCSTGVRQRLGMPSVLQARLGRPSVLKARLGRPNMLKARLGMPNMLKARLGMPNVLMARLRRPARSRGWPSPSGRRPRWRRFQTRSAAKTVGLLPNHAGRVRSALPQALEMRGGLAISGGARGGNTPRTRADRREGVRGGKNQGTWSRGGGQSRGAWSRGGGWVGSSARRSVTKEELDKQLDDYMSVSKSRLDADLDAYMAMAGDE